MKLGIVLVAAAVAGCSAAQPKPNAIAQPTTVTTGLSNAEILYGYRCKGCHEPATPGAPDRKALATFAQQEIIDALSKGAMKPLATGLTQQEMRDLAAFLSEARNVKRR
jgi:cytochrome c553